MKYSDLHVQSELDNCLRDDLAFETNIYNALLYIFAKMYRMVGLFFITELKPVPSLPALGPWAPQAERGPSLESIYRVSLEVYFTTANWGPLKKKQKSGGPGHVPSVPIG